MSKKKREALTVTRLIKEVLVDQLSIPFKQIVNDTSFRDYTGSQRPDLLISEFEFDGENEEQYIANLVAYAEAKDNCSVDDADWKDAIKQGKIKSKKLNLPYFIVTNCKTSVFYNAKTLKEITLNKNPIREFQTIDILRLIKNRLIIIIIIINYIYIIIILLYAGLFFTYFYIKNFINKSSFLTL